MSPALRCACPKCVCEVEPSTAVVRDGQSFCSDACATRHPNHEPCHGNGSADANARIELESLCSWCKPAIQNGWLVVVIALLLLQSFDLH